MCNRKKVVPSLWDEFEFKPKGLIKLEVFWHVYMISFLELEVQYKKLSLWSNYNFLDHFKILRLVNLSLTFSRHIKQHHQDINQNYKT